MSSQVSIRTLYSPVQPGAVQNENVIYNEFAPDNRLNHIIYCYWKLESCTPLNQPFTYRVVSDGCTDIFFDLRNPSENYVMGFSTTYSNFLLGRTFQYAGIRFLPGTFAQIFRIEATELKNRVEYLKDISPQAHSSISENFDPDGSDKNIKRILDNYFLSLLRYSDFIYDTRLLRALQTILSSGGDLRIRERLEDGISTRHLRRLFNTRIGGTPKTFSKIVRFQRLLKSNIISKENLTLWEAGYYDQSHFIKEFKTLSGTVPSKLLGK